MSQAIQGATFHVEHVVPRSRGGASSAANLALACPSCNLHKSDSIEAEDRRTAKLWRLFHPRIDRWPDHFEFVGYVIRGRTPTGRVTVRTMRFNDKRRIVVRQLEASLGLFPPA